MFSFLQKLVQAAILGSRCPWKGFHVRSSDRVCWCGQRIQTQGKFNIIETNQ